MLLLGAAVAALAVVAYVVVAVTMKEDSGPTARPIASVGDPADSGTSPVSYSSSPSTDVYAAIDRRTGDGTPLTLEESFPSSARTITITDAKGKKTKAKLGLSAQRLDADCADAVWGAGVADELRRGGCTQATRALYTSQKKKYVLAVTVFNLAAVQDADRLVGVLDTVGGGGFVRPLPVASVEPFARGFSMARGLAMGHYAVVAWAQRLDGGGDEQDEVLLELLIEGGKAPGPLGRAARGRPAGG